MRNRREFFKELGILLGGLSLSFINGCKRSPSPREELTSRLQNFAVDYKNYIVGEGYVYDVNVDHQKIHVNISKNHFETGDRLNYTTGKMLVRVYDDYISVKYEGRLTNEAAVNTYDYAEELTDKVLEAVVQENDRLSKINKSDVLKDLK